MMTGVVQDAMSRKIYLNFREGDYAAATAASYIVESTIEIAAFKIVLILQSQLRMNTFV